MSVKYVKRVLLLLTVVLVSTSIVLLDTITSQSTSASDRSIGDLPSDLPVARSPQTPLKKGGLFAPPFARGGLGGIPLQQIVLPPLETADKIEIGKEELHQRFQLRPSISQGLRVPPFIRSIPQKIPEKISKIIGKLLDIEPPILKVTSATSSRYETIVGYAEDCYGGTACRLGMISAEKLTETATEPPGSEVSLKDGITGHFIEGSCGANCSDSTISWDYRGSRYTLGIKVGKQETLVKMADVRLRKLVKGLQELLTGQERGSLIEKMEISDQSDQFIDRSKRGGDYRNKQTLQKSHIYPQQIYASNPDDCDSEIPNGEWIIPDYELTLPDDCDTEKPNGEGRTPNSELTLPKVGRYAVLRLGDGINYDKYEVVEDIKTLQNLLMKKGLLRYSELDGMFGPTTMKAVKKFQKSRGIDADGIVGEKTWSELWNKPVEVYLPYDNLISSLYLDEIIESIPPEIRLYAWNSVPLILWECERNGVTDLGQIAYILATAEHESYLGKWMVEFASGWAYEGRSDLGNNRFGDGPRYKGRGFVQITGRRNYTYWSDRLGIDLVRYPEKAASPEIAAKILVRGMRDGTFTRNHWLSKYIRGRARDFYNARRIVNGLDRASDIADIAKAYYKVL